MNDPSPVAGPQRGADGQHDVDDVGDGQRSFGLGEQRAEVSAAQVLHHQERGPVVRESEVEDLDDVAMLDLRQRLGFAQKALAHPVGQARAVAPGRGRLERHRAPEFGVDRAVNGAHPAAPDHLAELIPIDLPWGLLRRSGAGLRAQRFGVGLLLGVLAHDSGHVFGRRPPGLRAPARSGRCGPGCLLLGDQEVPCGWGNWGRWAGARRCFAWRSRPAA